MRRIVVLGGGISGLAAANRLLELAEREQTPVEVRVLEGSSRAGGCIETIERDGTVAELGPDAILIKPAVSSLLERLGLGHDIEGTPESFRRVYVECDGRLLPLPSDFRLFAPSSEVALAHNGILSVGGVLRAALEPLIPPRHDDADESIASFVTRRFGRELFERLAQPLTSGIYSGAAENVSIEATMPFMRDLERRYGSVIRGLAVKRSAAQKVPQLRSLRGGLGRIVDALAARIGTALQLGRNVARIEPADEGWIVRLEDGECVVADAVVCALPAHAAARVLDAACAPLASGLRSLRYHGIATVTCAYHSADVPPLPPTTGFVVPATARRTIRSATFVNQKFPQRTDAGTVLIRTVACGAEAPELLERSDAELIAGVRADLCDLLGIRAEPRLTLVRRWRDAMPEYSLGHLGRIAAIEAQTRELSSFALAGSAYRGAGIADCIASGESAAERLFKGTFPQTGTDNEWTYNAAPSSSSATATR